MFLMTRHHVDVAATSTWCLAMPTTLATLTPRRALSQSSTFPASSRGNRPSDLDLHGVSSNNEHIYCHSKIARGKTEEEEGADLIFQLNKDDQDGNGFERITLLDMKPNSTYWFAVHQRSDNGELASSGAKIEILGLATSCKQTAGLSTDEPVTISVPRFNSSDSKGLENVWRVFSLRTDSRGNTRLDVHNEITHAEGFNPRQKHLSVNAKLLRRAVKGE